jgi:hypothetical protein
MTMTMTMVSHNNDDTTIELNQEIRIGSTVIEDPDRVDQNETRRLISILFHIGLQEKFTLLYSYGLVLRVRWYKKLDLVD